MIWRYIFSICVCSKGSNSLHPMHTKLQCAHLNEVPTHGKKMCRLTMVDSVDHDVVRDPLYGFTPLWLGGGTSQGTGRGFVSNFRDCFVWTLNKHHFLPYNSGDHFRDPAKKQSKLCQPSKYMGCIKVISGRSKRSQNKQQTPMPKVSSAVNVQEGGRVECEHG